MFLLFFLHKSVDSFQKPFDANDESYILPCINKNANANKYFIFRIDRTSSMFNKTIKRNGKWSFIIMWSSIDWFLRKICLIGLDQFMVPKDHHFKVEYFIFQLIFYWNYLKYVLQLVFIIQISVHKVIFVQIFISSLIRQAIVKSSKYGKLTSRRIHRYKAYNALLKSLVP